MEFRLFSEADINTYLGWVNQNEIWEVDNSGEFQIRTIESFQGQWSQIVSWRRSWIMEIDSRAIGYIGFVSDEKDKLTDEFFIVIGSVNEWGRGHGKKAMQWLFQKASSLGLSQLTGQVLGNNERALRFYESQGFQVVKEQDPTFERNGETYRTLLIERQL